MTADLAATDAAARAQALDVTRSWLVQAPAGSGKTELLVQRILALLAIVDEPERIVAATFTVKAAHEMRARVMRALTEARAATPPKSPHHQQTLALAAAVLARDAQRGWQLLDYPGRMDIGTIDALAQRIAHQAPITSALGSVPPVDTEARRLHRAAAVAALASATADDHAWHTVLVHFDNNAEAIVSMLAALLARRDQWLPAVGALKEPAARAALEQALASDVAAVLAEVESAWGEAGVDANVPLLAEMRQLLQYAAQHRPDDAEFAALAAHASLPLPHPDALVHWRTLGNFLLVKGGAKFRAKLDSKLGFPAIGSGAGSGERRAMNEQARAWFERAQAQPGLAELVDRARRLPDPQYTDSARALIDALIDVLPRVVAQLMVTFGDEGACDFTEVTLRALAALGDPEAPSEVLLAHDVRIEHLLVDEFQDTSQVQLALLSRLTAGWAAGDGRTLFAVGDPMQSIYRFRAADVRIFLQAAAEGVIGNVGVGTLRLARNFRSQARLVDEVNTVFPRVLARQTRVQRAEVAFAAAAAAVAATADELTFDLVRTADDEAAIVVAHVRSALAAGMRDVAILARARGHFAAIHAALRGAGIAYQAVKLESLAERPVTLDLLWLTRALTQPAERLAWLAVLRAPWCGLALPDLLALANAATHRPLGVVAREADSQALLSPEGAARLARLVNAIADASKHAELPLPMRVRAAWLALGGPACYGHAANLEAAAVDRDAAEAFFVQLARHARGGDLPDWERFCQSIATLQADAPAAADTRVKLMTLHAAKGLEFDAVILPGLDRRTRGSETRLLRLRTRGTGLIVGSPPPRASTGDDAIERYLLDVEKDEERAELARLLYVGFTRARHRLHLVARASTQLDRTTGAWQWSEPGSSSALGALWPALAQRAPAPWQAGGAADTTPDVAADPAPLPLQRLPVAYRGLAHYVDGPASVAEDAATHASDEPDTADPSSAPVYDWARATSAVVGTIVHRVLVQVAAEGLAHWPLSRVDGLCARITAELKSAGVPAGEHADASERILQSLRNSLDDERGRWLFDASHTEAASEWALTARTADGVQRLVLDRTFVSGGMRWIVDFKIARHEGGGMAEFMARERERHRPQLERYASAVAHLDARPITLALYYPLLRQFVSFPWSGHAAEG
jgi:ATP-dependent exoDNAse (exonuclease V) beta subunit